MLGDGEQPGEFGQICVDPGRILHHGLQRSLKAKGYFTLHFQQYLYLQNLHIFSAELLFQRFPS